MRTTILRRNVLAVYVTIALSITASSVANAQSPIPFVAQPSWDSTGSRIAIPVGNVLEVRDVLTGDLVFTTPGDDRLVNVVVWNADSTLLATSNGSNTAKVWNGQTGELLQSVINSDDYVVAIGWKPGTNALVTGGLDVKPTLRVWDVETGRMTGGYDGGTINAGAFSPDGKLFAKVLGSTLDVLNVQDNFNYITGYRPDECCSGSLNNMTVLKWSTSGDLLAAGSIDGLVSVFESKSGKLLSQLSGNPNVTDAGEYVLSWVRDVRFGDDDTTVQAISGDGTFREWDIATQKVIREEKLPALASASFSPYGARIAYLDASYLPSADGTPSPKTSAEGGLNIVVPAPSVDSFNKLLDRCAADGDPNNATLKQIVLVKATEATVGSVVAQVNALPEGTIPAACKADLLAVGAELSKKTES